MEVVSISKAGKVLIYKGVKVIYSNRYKVYYVKDKAFTNQSMTKKYIDNLNNNFVLEMEKLQKEVAYLETENRYLEKKIPWWRR